MACPIHNDTNFVQPSSEEIDKDKARFLSENEGDLIFFAEETTKKLQVQSLEYQTSRNKKNYH